MRTTIAVVVLLVACGDDGGNNPPGDGGGGDGGIDAAIDAPDPTACPLVVGGGATCGTTAAPTTPATGSAACDPLTQAGCNAGEKCTWIVDQVTPAIGHVGCAPVGMVATDCACTTGVAGATGYDDCVGGSVCVGGVCKRICDPQGGAPTCTTGDVCTRYANTFEIGGTTVAGVCDPGCDPLTQCASRGAKAEACGSVDPSTPNRGCFGYDAYSCSPAGTNTLALTDRMPPRTNASGNPFINGCAPGFIPFFFSMTGSTTVLCSGLCAALEIDNTPAHAGNAKGDASFYAKLPTEATLVAGNGTCDVGKKGSDASSSCRFIWPYVVDNQGMLPPAFAAGPHLDRLGVCMAIAFFQYDSNNDMVPDAPYPDCATLPPRSAATPGDVDDAADWGCQKFANAAFTSRRNPALGDLQVGGGRPFALVRHAFR